MGCSQRQRLNEETTSNYFLTGKYFGHVKLFAAAILSSSRHTNLIARAFPLPHFTCGTTSSVSFDSCWVFVHVPIRESLGPGGFCQ